MLKFFNAFLLLKPFLFISTGILFFSNLSAQTGEIPAATMTWEELSLKWQSLAVEDKNIESLPWVRAALEKARVDSGETSLDYGNSCDNLGYSLHETGQYLEAEYYLQKAVDLGAKYLGENHEDYITRLSNLAMLHMDMNQLSKAAAELEQCVRLADKNLGEDNPDLGVLINNLGLAYENLGYYDSALHYYRRALSLTEKTTGTRNIRYTIRLENISAVLRNSGHYEESLAYALQATDILEKISMQESVAFLYGKYQVINSLYTLSRYQEAAVLLDELLLLSQKIGVQETAQTYDFATIACDIYYVTGQYKRCIDFAQLTLARSNNFPNLNHKYGRIAGSCMKAFEKLGKMEEAGKYASLSIGYYLEGLKEQFTEADQFQLYNSWRQIQHSIPLVFASRHPEQPELTALAYDYILNIKGSALNNRQQIFQSLRQTSDTKLSGEFEEWMLLQSAISKQYALQPLRRNANLDSLVAVSNNLERILALDSETFRLSRRTADWKEVQAALAPDEAAIEFGRLVSYGEQKVSYFAWVIQPEDAFPRQVFLFNEKELENLNAIRSLYAAESTDSGKNLRQLLWQPLEPLLKGMSTIYYAPDGILHQINFGAVPVDNNTVIGDKFHLHLLVNTRQITPFKKHLKMTAPTIAIVFGGIHYESDSLALAKTNAAQEESDYTIRNFSGTRGLTLGNEWLFLPGTMREVEGVKKHLGKMGTNIVFGDGFLASEGFFKKNIRDKSPQLLHLATHGFFINAPDATARTGFESAENPMARTGLVLAGANRVWSGGTPIAGQEDGILTAMEISFLDLHNNHLAILSACGTGKGEMEAGEGIIGLQRAFKMAGTEDIIMTLWNVQDNYAQEFMDLFYMAWLTQKMDIPNAFHEAQWEMRKKYSNPFQPAAWAGFILLE